MKVLFVEVHVYDKLIPLVSGYLQAYAAKDPHIAAGVDFHRHVALQTVDVETLYRDVSAHHADVYAFSCYVWNMGTIKHVARRLAAEQPHASLILGGHQAANNAAKYAAGFENIYVCNGEGEITFANFLKTLYDGRDDFRDVNGLGYYRGGELITTPYQDKMDDLDAIPSPFLSGLFSKGRYSGVIFETNRGCPFACAFCTWGGPGQTVTKFATDRVMQEITWLASNGVHFVYIADANWGMLKRDVDISRHIADCSRTFKAPNMVFYAAAKNNPDRSVACVQIFHEAGIVTTQAVGVQSMNEVTLQKINRSNIKLSKFKVMQDNLATQRISSMSELMWPLPGETLTSLKGSIADLIETGTDCVIVYSVLLINNAELTARRDEFGLVTVPSTDPADESEVVIATNEVDREEYEAGFWFFYAVHAAYNVKGLACLSKYLHLHGIVSYRDLFERFAHFYRTDGRSALYRFVRDTIDTQKQCEPPLTIGKLTHLLLHEAREDFSRLLTAFVSSQDFWSLPEARWAFELDLLNRPYIYSNTRPETFDRQWEFTRPIAAGNALRVPIAASELPVMRTLIRKLDLPETSSPRLFDVDHRVSQLPYVPGREAAAYASYCHGMILRANSILPQWKAVNEAGATASA